MSLGEEGKVDIDAEDTGESIWPRQGWVETGGGIRSYSKPRVAAALRRREGGVEQKEPTLRTPSFGPP